MHNLSYATAVSLLRNIERYTPADYEILGVTQEHFELLAQPQLWDLTQKAIVVRTLQALIFGTLNIMGISKIVVPAEFLAAHVATIIAPENRMLACVWLSAERSVGPSALELSARQESPTTYDPASADHLFALVCQLSDHEENSFARARYKQRLGLRVTQAEKEMLQ